MQIIRNKKDIFKFKSLHKFKSLLVNLKFIHLLSGKVTLKIYLLAKN